jgi:hypothetical protein
LARRCPGRQREQTISCTGKREFAIHGDDFFNFIWLRKVEVGDVEIKANGLYEIELEREGKATLFFVPINHQAREIPHLRQGTGWQRGAGEH